MNTRDRVDSLRAQAQEIVDRAERSGRGLYRDEESQLDRLLAEADEAENTEKHERDREGRRMRAELSGDGPVYGDGLAQRRPVGLHPWTSELASSRVNLKEAPSGSVQVTLPSQLLPQIVELGRPEARLLNVLGRQMVGPSDRFGYLAQVARTNNAAPVAIGALKPTSEFTFEMREGQVRVLAHLSPSLPRTWLLDVADMNRFVESELAWGLEQALERQVLFGSGEDPELDGIVGQLAPAITGGDFLTLIRQQLAAFERAGVSPNAVVLSPEDDAAIDLLVDDSRRFYSAGPFSSGPQSLWALPRVVTNALEPGQALVGDLSRALLAIREDVTITWSDAAGFAYNTVQFRCEMRANVALTQPFAIVQVDSSQIGPAPEAPEGRRSAPTTTPPTSTTERRKT